MSANVEAMVREGVTALKSGRKDEARALLSKAVELDPYNEEGWLWLSGIVEMPEDQLTCLENVLAINPNNLRAQQGLAYLNRKSTPASDPASAPRSTPAPAAPPPAPAAAPPPTPAADPFSGLGGFADAFSSSSTASSWNEGGMETSSSSSYRAINEPSGDVLDDWVSGLGIGSDGRPTPAQTSTSPFTDINFGDDPVDEPEEDMFAGGPFGGAAFSTPPTTSQPPAPTAYNAGPSTMPPPASAYVQQASPTPARMSPSSDDGVRAPATNPFASAFPADFKPMDDLDLADAGSQDNFSLIPQTIKATRIPGIDGERSPLWTVLIMLLVLANLGAAVLVMTRLVG